MTDSQRLNELTTELTELIDKLQLISIKTAAEIRGVTRSAIIQLIQRDRLRAENILGRPMVYKSDVDNFHQQKPGPAVGAIYKPRSSN